MFLSIGSEGFPVLPIDTYAILSRLPAEWSDIILNKSFALVDLSKFPSLNITLSSVANDITSYFNPPATEIVAGEKMGFNTGTVVIPFGTVAQESLDVAKYVYDNVIKENSSFNYIVRNGAAFSVSGYVIDKKEYGVIIVRCYIKRYCLEFAVLKSEIKPLQ